ncbi:hypothetical protein CLV84_2891 [Neolewinella xylanilytica]|uniref:Uncharacterized protein n=1 Tax=Neolewinella xylanilytica TaxID=1514080 RepID=A0A2S6I470_9BACT|nr:hypothetical protein [Neolewinella xylanilytica]PPK85977.1 hypothetical protein CLV84_2891 [Neolewinella xylanilytica]
MRNRIAVWGRDAQEKRVLITIELQVTDNIVRIETFPEKVVSDDVYAAFMNKWRKEEAAELPEPDRVIARELSVTDSLLPDDLKAEQTDMIVRAQTEWHFHVLSEKLAQSYRSELAEIEDRIERAGSYSSDLWNQAKAFWQKVQSQLQDKTLLREQGNELRKRSDAVFARLKELREEVNAQYEAESAKHKEKFGQLLRDVEKRISEGTHLNKVFQELRELQRKFHGIKFTKQDRDEVYNRIDAAFKAVKQERGQGKEDTGGALSRNEARYQGLLKAMERMEKSIGRDKEDLKFENRRIERTDGQLEAQIRQAKIVMIESRINSKNEKLEDMVKTKTMLEARIEKDKQRAEKQSRKAAERQAKEAAKAKIAAEMGNRQVSPEEAAKLAAAAAEIRAGKKQAKVDRKSLRSAAPSDTVANFAALSQVLAGEVHVPRKQRTPAPSLLEKTTERIDDAIDVATHKVQQAVDTAKAAGQVLSEEE